MLKVVLTGGIASGKSFILDIISKCGIPVISADKEISEIYQNEKILLKIGKVFDVKNPTKESIKPIVLKDKTKLRILEKILYKELYKRFDIFSKTCREKRFKICVFEVPLLFEKNTSRRYDKIINIETPVFIQKRRFLKRKNASEKDFYKFLNLQLHFQKKRTLTKKFHGINFQNFDNKTIVEQKIKTLLQNY